jgi:hypothetical protein
MRYASQATSGQAGEVHVACVDVVAHAATDAVTAYIDHRADRAPAIRGQRLQSLRHGAPPTRAPLPCGREGQDPGALRGRGDHRVGEDGGDRPGHRQRGFVVR